MDNLVDSLFDGWYAAGAADEPDSSCAEETRFSERNSVQERLELSGPGSRHDASYYAYCVAGGITASSNRWWQTPLDVVKCNMQVAPQKYTGILPSLRLLYRQEGLWRGWFKGLGPTAVAYGLQTGTKYGLYEVLRDHFSAVAGTNNEQYRGMIYVMAAATAEACAAVLMCPFEMLKVHVQTTTTGPRNFRPALAHMWQHRHSLQFPFGALKPLWCRQIPSTVANFYTFERTVQFCYGNILTGQDRDSYDRSTQLLVTLAAGYVAGFVSSVISHPADSLVSRMTMPVNRNKTVMQVARETGFVQLATRGLLPRTLLTGTVIGLQWWTYDAFKTVMGMGTTGGREQWIPANNFEIQR
jgi:solute carrier family 25 phosphate transporter 3